MLTLKEQVVSFELAKRLKELYVKQDSYFSWSNCDTPYPRLVHSHMELERSGDYLISAYTVAELCEMLPELPAPQRLSFGIEKSAIRECLGGKYYGVHDALNYPEDYDVYDDNLANVLAMLLIHLIENKLIEVEK
jgi:hypothetical protein